jgi:hypothetical protein
MGTQARISSYIWRTAAYSGVLFPQGGPDKALHYAARFLVHASKAERELGWTAKVHTPELAALMVDADRAALHR